MTEVIQERTAEGSNWGISISMVEKRIIGFGFS